MATTEIYVDPSIAANSGSGTVGDPYGDLEYAVRQSTQGAGPTRFNIKAGADELVTSGTAVLRTALIDTSVTPAFAGSNAAPIIFQGYTSTAGDGGIGVIDCNAGSLISNSMTDLHFIDLELKNSFATSPMFVVGSFCSFIRCRIHDVGGAYAIQGADWSIVDSCTFYDCFNVGVLLNGGRISHNVFYNGGTRDFGTAITASTSGVVVERNILKLDNASNGIQANARAVVRQNSIYSNGGTGKGIIVSGWIQEISNNLVEGFSGAGGIGIDAGSGDTMLVFGGNSVYNCTTAYSTPDHYIDSASSGETSTNETLTASPFSNPSSNDFSPTDQGEVKEGYVPNTFPAF